MMVVWLSLSILDILDPDGMPIYYVLFTLGLLFMIPANAKHLGLKAPIWALMTFIAGPITAVVYYINTRNKYN